MFNTSSEKPFVGKIRHQYRFPFIGQPLAQSRQSRRRNGHVVYRDNEQCLATRLAHAVSTQVPSECGYFSLRFLCGPANPALPATTGHAHRFQAQLDRSTEQRRHLIPTPEPIREDCLDNHK